MPGVNGGRPLAAGSTIEMVVEAEKVFIVENRKGASRSGSGLETNLPGY